MKKGFIITYTANDNTRKTLEAVNAAEMFDIVEQLCREHCTVESICDCGEDNTENTQATNDYCVEYSGEHSRKREYFATFRDAIVFINEYGGDDYYLTLLGDPVPYTDIVQYCIENNL